MRIKNNSKHWRLNVVILYYEEQLVEIYRSFLLGMLRDLASIYRIDYAISEDHPFPSSHDLLPQAKHKSKADLIYFRSNENSRVDRKKLRSVVDCIFDKPVSPAFYRVEVFHQIYRVLPQYPFPKNYYRPLSYPFVEHYVGNQKKLYIYSDQIMRIVEKDQDRFQN